LIRTPISQILCGNASPLSALVRVFRSVSKSFLAFCFVLLAQARISIIRDKRRRTGFCYCCEVSESITSAVDRKESQQGLLQGCVSSIHSYSKALNDPLNSSAKSTNILHFPIVSYAGRLYHPFNFDSTMSVQCRVV
jgi:hypothetical protein